MVVFTGFCLGVVVAFTGFRLGVVVVLTGCRLGVVVVLTGFRLDSGILTGFTPDFATKVPNDDDRTGLPYEIEEEFEGLLLGKGLLLFEL